MAEKEMMVTINNGWLYFKANAKTAETGFYRLLKAFEDAGIDVSNVEFGSCELRDEKGDAIDEFQINPACNRHYDCNHDCDAIYQAKEKFYEYIGENFSIDTDGMNLIGNIIDWVWLQSFDKEDTVNILSALLDGIGITKREIEQFIDW